jgi:hypothetical protein
MNPDKTKEDTDLVLSKRAGALLMINKDEKKLIKVFRVKVLDSEREKGNIAYKLDPEHVEIA